MKLEFFLRGRRVAGFEARLDAMEARVNAVFKAMRVVADATGELEMHGPLDEVEPRPERHLRRVK